MTGMADTIAIHRVDCDSALFENALRLRDRVLREPLGRPSAREERARDLGGQHFVALSGNQVAGCTSLFRSGTTGELKAMAVSGEARGVGIGGALCRYVETIARESGCTCLVAEARSDALGFYKSCGFMAVGEDYMMHGVSHRRVRKDLAALQ